MKNRGRYPPDWEEISKQIRFGRAAGRCECEGECSTRGARSGGCADPDPVGRCNAQSEKPNPRTRSVVVLTVAHLDDNPQTTDPARLRAMCQACHLAYDTDLRRQHRQQLIGSYPLFVEQEPRQM